ncbi:MAG: protein kinase [Gammaproteobacteria bacterium]|jgi:serine/threonine protein kinase|nr:protein kinase [Gammaproteobacteria bacterium]
MNKAKSYIGQSVGRYTFNELVGKGSIGAVYKAFDQRLLRPVAIKVSSPHAGNEATPNDRILREAQIVARVEHANIVPIYDVVDHEGSVLIVMRLLKGRNLDELKQLVGKPLDVNEALKIMHQVMLGMDYAHSRGVIHADLKPGNIFVSSSNEIFILDFGLAAVLELEKPDKSKMYGTPLYMSPEQCNGIYHDARSDIYSLGLIFYALITGRHPFADAQSMQQLLLFQMEKIPERPDEINPAVPENLSNCVMRALDKDPTRRFNSCRDFFRKIESSLQIVDTGEYKIKDLRWDPRVNMNLQAQLQLQDSEEIYTAEITDLSVSGASILVPVSLKSGTKLKIDFDIMEDNNHVTMSSQATVLWEDKKSGMQMFEAGLSFDSLENLDKQYLGFYIRNRLLA